MKKRILSMICVLALCLGLLPSAAFAADGDTAIMLGTNGISGYDDSTNSYDYIYFGNWNAPDQYTTTGPIKWRVLDNQTNTGENGLFLLSDRLFGAGNSAGGGVYFDNSSPYSNVWQDSDAQKWCQDFYGKSFSTGEQGAVFATTKTDAEYNASSGDLPLQYGVSQLEEDKVFFLSAEEAENSAYGFIDDDARKAYFGNGTLHSRSMYFPATVRTCRTINSQSGSNISMCSASRSSNSFSLINSAGCNWTLSSKDQIT